MNKVIILQGHVLDRLRELPDESVQCVVTSPPYWGLRDYGIEPQVWGGDEGCGHEWEEHLQNTKHPNNPSNMPNTGANLMLQGTALRTGKPIKTDFCRLCNAWRGSYGLEPTIELYVQHTVEIFREVRRVLRKDGVCFLNLGDSYASTPPGKCVDPFATSGLSTNKKRNKEIVREMCRLRPERNLGSLKPKDLCGIPWRVALALQADGWFLRSDIIWAKANPMPESVTDRPTRAHEYIFLLTKSQKYFWDAEAIKEKSTGQNGQAKGRTEIESL